MDAGTSSAIIDMSGLEAQLTLEKFGDTIEAVLPLVGIAVLVGFVFYVIRYAIGLFRGV